MKTQVRKEGEVSLVSFTGRLELGEGTSAFRDLLQGLIRDGHKMILVNLSEVTYVDSSGIGEISSIYSFSAKQGAVIKLCCLTKRVEDSLKSGKMNTAYDIHPDEKSALRSFGSNQAF